MSAKGVSGIVNSFFGSVSMVYRFQVVIDSGILYDLGDWEKASGLSVTWQPCEYRPGDMGNDFLLYPGLTKYENIKLTRAVCGDSQDVKDWLERTAKDPQPVSAAIALVDWVGIPTIQWGFREMIPIGWSVVEFNAGGGSVATETLQLAHTGFLDDLTGPVSPGSRSLGW